MAGLRVAGIDNLVDELDLMEKGTPEMINHMLAAGADVVAQAMREETENAGLIDTGAMLKSIRPTKPKAKAGTHTVEVYPQGKDKKGVRNAEKAFVNNYGTKGRTRKIQATHFIEKAIEKSENDVYYAMQDVFNEY